MGVPEGLEVWDFKPVTASCNFLCFQSRLSTLLPCWTHELTRDAHLLSEMLSHSKLEVNSSDENFQFSLLSSWYPLPHKSAFPIFSPYLKLDLSPLTQLQHWDFWLQFAPSWTHLKRGAHKHLFIPWDRSCRASPMGCFSSLSFWALWEMGMGRDTTA